MITRAELDGVVAGVASVQAFINSGAGKNLGPQDRIELLLAMQAYVSQLLSYSAIIRARMQAGEKVEGE